MNLQEIVDKLIEDGKVTQEELDNIRENLEIESTIHFVTDDLHLRFCKLNHDNGECDWWNEEENTETLNHWILKSHSKWKKLFLTFLSSANTRELTIKFPREETTSAEDDLLPSL